MKVIVVGLGVQGQKRRQHAGADFVSSVDPVNPDADFKSLQEVPLAGFDAALVCVPDQPKFEIIRYLLENRKHVLVEKPLWVPDEESLRLLETLANSNGSVLYTAYNHRFEPHFIAMRDLIRSGELGQIYSCRMFYGNGTARLVRESEWRDTGAGVLPDLGSHLLDTYRFWFDSSGDAFNLVSVNRFENKSPDHAIISLEGVRPRVELEMTLCMWRNHFQCDVLAENGSAHIRSLCKWGPASFTRRRRVFPSGHPPEERVTLTRSDPTWEAEYAHFKEICRTGGANDLSGDLWLHKVLTTLGAEAVSR